MQDDDYTTSTTTLTRRVQKHKQQHQQPKHAMSPNRRYAVQHPKKPGLKDKITQAFTLTRSDKKRYHETPVQQPKTKIQNFSFMNSKMGMYASEEDMREYVTKDLETKSDIGGVRKSAEVPSWYKDTLSASTLRRAKHALDKKGFSSSVPNLTEAEQYKTMPNGHSVQNGKYRGESLSDFGADIKTKKKVNRFKFWKVLGKKGKKTNKNFSQNLEPDCLDIKL